MRLSTTLLLLLAALSSEGLARSRPTVHTGGGAVQGVWVPAQRGARRFAAFLGIPYAAPPVGELRFKAPQPAKKWSGILDASDDPPLCAQVARFGVLAGQEDCLYLNVYAPKCAVKRRSSKLLPVFVVIHGGGFKQGSGRMSAIGPHFLVSHDIIVVGFQYRLGPFGFVSLDTPDLPGNAGLKDMAMALQWVKQNVKDFGGDPDQITVFGWSTGASSVHILSLLPETRALFSRAVLLSGHAITARAYTERHVQLTNAIAALLGARNNNTDTVTQALQNAAVEDLLRASRDDSVLALGQLLPSPERRSDSDESPKLLTRDTESLLLRPATGPMPIIMGVTEREGLYKYYNDGLIDDSDSALDEMLPSLVPADLLPGRDTAALLGVPYRGGPGPLSSEEEDRVATRVRQEYSNGGALAQDRDVFINYLGDSFIYVSTWRAARFIANSSTEEAPLRLYNFGVQDKYNWLRAVYNMTLPGVSHADDVGYLFLITDPDLHQSTAELGVSSAVLRRNTEFMARFARGDPLPDWPAVRPGLSDAAEQPVLFEGPGLLRAVRASSPAQQQAFWDTLYQDLRSEHSSIAGD